jgi:hypothetical protein
VLVDSLDYCSDGQDQKVAVTVTVTVTVTLSRKQNSWFYPAVFQGNFKHPVVI